MFHFTARVFGRGGLFGLFFLLAIALAGTTPPEWPDFSDDDGIPVDLGLDFFPDPASPATAESSASGESEDDPNAAGFSDDDHDDSLRRPPGPPPAPAAQEGDACPARDCNGKLVARATSANSPQRFRNTSFLGCSRFPACRTGIFPNRVRIGDGTDRRRALRGSKRG